MPKYQVEIYARVSATAEVEAPSEKDIDFEVLLKENLEIEEIYNKHIYEY